MNKLWHFFFGKTKGMNEKIGIGGKITVEVRRYNPLNNTYGPWETIEKDKPNLLTNAGRDWFKDQGYTNTSAGTRGCGWIALSENATAPADGDTSVTGEITTNGLARADAGTKTNNAGAATALIEHTWTASGSFTAVQKCGLLTASSGGTLVHENTITSTALSSSDQIKVTWNLTLND